MNCIFKLCALFAACICGIGLVFSQTDSSVLLYPHIITAQKTEKISSLTKHSDIDSITKSQFLFNDLGTLLSLRSNFFIKTYAPSSLASSSFRGGNANHTAVFWNGFNIQSPTLGQNDLSLIPVSLIDDITLLQGSQTTQWGSGSLSGAIMLRNKFNLKNPALIYGASFNSMFNQVHATKINLNYRKTFYYLNINYTDAKNTFNYYNLTNEITTQKNSAAEQIAIQPGVYFTINNKQALQLHGWIQHNFRQLPPTLLQDNSHSNQTDKINRICAEWTNTINQKTSLFIRSAYFNEKLIYNDSISSIYSITHTQKNINELEYDFKTKKHLLTILFNHIWQWANSGGYVNSVSQHVFSPQLNLKSALFNNKLSNILSLRKEILQNFATPLLLSNSSTFQIHKNILLSASANKIYRLPTFNDLYWFPGGNIHLKPEKGYSIEAGLKYQQGIKKWNLSFAYSIYSRKVIDWIIWLPMGNYWSPQNIMQVWSRGTETESFIQFKNKKFLSSLTVNTSYVLSTNEKAKTENDNSLGKQLIYTPMYSGYVKLIVAYYNTSLTYTHNYTGYRYTSTDNTEFLPPYFLSDIYISTKINFKKNACVLAFHVYNLFNQNYQVMLNRPMPLRNYQISILLQFNNPKYNKL